MSVFTVYKQYTDSTLHFTSLWSYGETLEGLSGLFQDSKYEKENMNTVLTKLVSGKPQTMCLCEFNEQHVSISQ